MRPTFTLKSILPMLLVAGMAISETSEATAQEGTGPKVLSADPASGTKVESLSEIILTMDQPTTDVATEWGMENAPLPQIFGAPTDVEAVLWYPQGDLTKLKIVITPTITADGTYEITIPAGYIQNDAWESNPETKLVYTIGSGSSGEEPVQYDLNYTSIEPGPGTYETLNIITLTFDTDVYVREESRAVLYKDNMLYKAVKMAVRDGNKVDLLFTNFDIKGSYDLVIEKAQLGDAKWLESSHLGHANPEIKVPGYIIKQLTPQLTYDFNGVVEPDGKKALANLEKFTLRFDSPWCPASEEEIAVYDYKDDPFPLTLSLGETLNEVVLTLDKPIEEAGQYKLIVPKGCFANTEYEETEGMKGALNPEIMVSFDVDPSLSVASTDADGMVIKAGKSELTLNGLGNASIYSVQGALVANVNVAGCASIALSSGIYVVRCGAEAIKVCVK